MGRKDATQRAEIDGRLLLGVALLPEEIGKRIKTARERKGYTQLTFALHADVSPSAVSKWERGQLPPVRELIRIAALLNVDPSELVEPPPTDSSQIAELRREVSDLREMMTELLRRTG